MNDELITQEEVKAEAEAQGIVLDAEELGILTDLANEL